MKKTLDPVKLLRETLAERCRKNPQYSIRAFARASGISHTVLSLVLSGKRPMSKEATGKLADHLNLNPTERKAILRKYSSAEDRYETLSLDSFELISDWYHYGILSALELPDAQLDPKWLAKKLGIRPLQAKLATERLLRLGLLEQLPDGSWKQSSAPIKIDNKTSTAATKKFHKQLLGLAAESIDRDPITDRDFSSMTFSMSASQIEYARQRMRDFRRELTAELENRATPEAVFNFTMQLYPITSLTKTPTQEKK